MTIGIGLACESGNTLILAADTRGSYEFGRIRNDEEVGKQFQLPGGFFACVAGTLVHCESFIAYFTTLTEHIPTDPTQILPDHIRAPMLEAHAHTIRDLYHGFLVRRTGMRFDEWKELMQKDDALFKRGLAMFEEAKISLEVLVGGFSYDNFVLLKLINKEPIEIVHSYDAIGSGADFALKALSDRAQNLHYSFQRSAVHVAEALEAAKFDAGVGDSADWVILERGGVRRLPAKHRVLEQLKSDYAGHKTDALDEDDAARRNLKRILYKAPMVPFRFNASEA